MSAGTWQNLKSTSVSLGMNSLVIVPAGLNPATVFGNYQNLGLTHVAGTPLVVPAGQGFGGYGVINDPVQCQGTVVATATQAIELQNGLTLSGTGAVNLGRGNLTVNDMVSSVSGGSLAATVEYVGYKGIGSFSQTGGTNTPYLLELGDLSSDSGSFSLSGSGLLSCTGEDIGEGGAGNFTATGGTNTCSGQLRLGVSRNGTYDLAGSAVLSVPGNEIFGCAGTGTFTQSGGTNNANVISFGTNAGSGGTYNLNGGLLIVSSMSRGSGSAAFNFNGGTLRPSSSSSISLPMTLGTSGSGATFDTAGYSVTLFSSLSGPGSLTKVDSGTLLLGGDNTYTGGTTVNAGTLQAAGAGSLPGYTTPGRITVASGAVLAVSAGGGGWTAASIGMLLSSNGSGFAAGSSLGIDTTGGSLAYAGSISGNMGLVKLGSNVLALSAASTYYGNTLIGGGSLALGSPLALQNSTLDTSGSGTLSFQSLTTATLGGLSGPGTLGLANTSSSAVALSVGNNNANTTYSGMLKGTGSLTKVGSGGLLLSGSNTYTGATTITLGKLTVDGWLTNSAVSVNGGTLGGTGYLNSVTVNAGGNLAPGDPQGVLNLSGNLVLAAGAGMDYDLDGVSTDDEVYMPSGSLTFSGQQFSNFGFTWTDGFGPGTYTLVNAQSITGLGSNLSGSIDGLPATLSVQNKYLMLTVVPEPSTFALLGVGVMGLIGWAWRRRIRNVRTCSRRKEVHPTEACAV